MTWFVLCELHYAVRKPIDLDSRTPSGGNVVQGLCCLGEESRWCGELVSCTLWG